MASISKRASGAWQNTNYGIRGTATDTITTLPTTIYSDGTNATVSIKGNTTQFGTPTPDNPIILQGTGERTGNLVRFYQEEMQDNLYGVDITVKNAEITLNGTVSAGSGHWVEIGYKFGGGTDSTDNVVIPCEPETTYTITIEILGGNSSEVRLIAFGTSNENRTVNIGSSLTTTFSGDINRIFISLGAEGTVFNNLKFRVMFNKGSAPLPYEPYGIKIPISSANTTTPVYLGEVESTRKIRKLVFDGTETSWKQSAGFFYNDSITPDYLRTSNRTVYCTHYQGINNVTSGSQVGDGECAFYSVVGVQRLYINDSNHTTVASFTAYLAAQYANGTPVTVWYVLATETTGIVNEPIRKIGDYADTVSGITVPTITGKDTFDVETTLKPSEVSLSYTGWHDASVKEKSENLFDNTTATLGKYIDSNGNEQASSVSEPMRQLNHSDYFHVSPNNTYTFASVKDATVQQTVAFVWYTSEKAFISRTTEVKPVETTDYSLTATSPNNAEYAIINYTTANNEVMLNTGETALPYEPYWK